jgi:hypothetical protein
VFSPVATGTVEWLNADNVVRAKKADAAAARAPAEHADPAEVGDDAVPDVLTDTQPPSPA